MNWDLYYPGISSRLKMSKSQPFRVYNLDNKRFTQNASPNNCHRLFNQKIMFEVEHESRNVNPVLAIPKGQIPLTAKAGDFPQTPSYEKSL